MDPGRRKTEGKEKRTCAKSKGSCLQSTTTRALHRCAACVVAFKGARWIGVDVNGAAWWWSSSFNIELGTARDGTACRIGRLPVVHVVHVRMEVKLYHQTGDGADVTQNEETDARRVPPSVKRLKGYLPMDRAPRQPASLLVGRMLWTVTYCNAQ